MVEIVKDPIASAHVESCIQSRNEAGFFGSLADAKLSPDEIRGKLSEMILALAKKSDAEAVAIARTLHGETGPQIGTNSFEKDRAQNLRDLAKIIKGL